MQFKKLNVNPAKRNTDDSYVKCISIALEIPYKKAYKLLAEHGIRQSLAMNDSRLFRNFMNYIGYIEIQLDKKCNVSKFSEHVSRGKVCILRIGKNGATVVKDNVIYDSYDPSNKIVNGYWVIR